MPGGKWHTTVGLMAAMLAVPALPWAQTAAPAARPAPAPAPAAAVPGQAAKPAATQPAAEPYSYNPEGRRDPFVSLVSRGAEPVSSGKHAEGLSGLMTAEVMLRGVLQSQGHLHRIGPGTRRQDVHGARQRPARGRHDPKHHPSRAGDHAGSQRSPLADQTTRGAEGT